MRLDMANPMYPRVKAVNDAIVACLDGAELDDEIEELHDVLIASMIAMRGARAKDPHEPSPKKITIL
jgi:hypothetical protein